jgi:hypothetical protein
MAIDNNIYTGLPEYSIIFRLLLDISLVLLFFIILFILDSSGHTDIPATPAVAPPVAPAVAPLFIIVFNPESFTQLGVFESA